MYYKNIKTSKQMNESVKEQLLFRDDHLSKYAAKRIEELESNQNQRVIEELEDIISNRTRLWTEELLGRIKQLKQETKR